MKLKNKQTKNMNKSIPPTAQQFERADKTGEQIKDSSKSKRKRVPVIINQSHTHKRTETKTRRHTDLDKDKKPSRRQVFVEEWHEGNKQN